MKQTYTEKLRDPRWQRLRLQILERDSFTCTLCGDTETELHIHHEEYVGEPWEAPIDKLKTLCKHCHKVVEELKTITLPIYKILKRRKENYYTLYLLSEYEGKNVITILKIPNDTQKPEFVIGMHADLIDVFYEYVHQNDLK